MNILDNKLNEIQKLVGDGLSAKNTVRALGIIGIDGYDEAAVKSFRLWND